MRCMACTPHVWHVKRALATTPNLQPQTEIGAECGCVQRFIIDREIEAPERFQAIQSYRWVLVGTCEGSLLREIPSNN